MVLHRLAAAILAAMPHTNRLGDLKESYGVRMDWSWDSPRVVNLLVSMIERWAPSEFVPHITSDGRYLRLPTEYGGVSYWSYHPLWSIPNVEHVNVNKRDYFGAWTQGEKKKPKRKPLKLEVPEIKPFWDDHHWLAGVFADTLPEYMEPTGLIDSYSPTTREEIIAYKLKQHMAQSPFGAMRHGDIHHGVDYGVPYGHVDLKHLRIPRTSPPVGTVGTVGHIDYGRQRTPLLGPPIILGGDMYEIVRPGPNHRDIIAEMLADIKKVPVPNPWFVRSVYQQDKPRDTASDQQDKPSDAPFVTLDSGGKVTLVKENSVDGDNS